MCCQVFKWVLKHHPKAKCFAETIDFSDVPEDWEEACLVFNELGSAGPHVINAAFHSHTKRNRAHWTMNWDVPPDFELPHPPKLDADECMDEGRSIRRYNANGTTWVRPLDKSWKGDASNPEADTRLPILVDDTTMDQPTHL